MSKERDLLLVALDFLDPRRWSDPSDQHVLNIISRDIELLLAQPEQEPAAWIIETEIHGKLSEWVCTDKKHYMEAHDGTKDPIPLYLAPPTRKPLDNVEIMTIAAEHTWDLKRFARAIEKAHGIGERNE